MIKILYDSGAHPDEPNAPCSEHTVDTLREADEFMNMVREDGGTITEWREMSASEERAYEEAIRAPHGY